MHKKKPYSKYCKAFSCICRESRTDFESVDTGFKAISERKILYKNQHL